MTSLVTRAFTLIELLVVISIITVLISILLPALSRTRQLAHRSICGGNLHGIYTAMQMYLWDSRTLPPLTRSPDIVVPPGGSSEMTDRELSRTPWDLMPVIYHGSSMGVAHSEFTNFGKLYEGGYVDVIQLFFCPSQTHPDMQYKTETNPWPPEYPRPITARFKRWNHVFSSYARRLGLSNITFDEVPPSTAIVADVCMFPWYTQTHHNAEGFNVLTVSGDARWTSDPYYYQMQEEFGSFNFFDAIRHCIDIFERLDRTR